LSDDVLQLAGLPGRLGEEQDPGGEAVQAVHCVQRLQPVLLNNIRVGDLRIRIQLFTSMRIRIQPFTLMLIQILLLSKVMGICYHWCTGLHFQPPDFKASIMSVHGFNLSL
jgi:hypothetical protein